jgi:glycosyltransferase involved in cell wall biosynthesis
VVIPVLNEDSLIQELIRQVMTNVELVTNDFEIILVDDGSSDNTWDKIEKSAMNEMRIKGIHLSRNFGHHYAISAGLHNSKGEWVVVMDGDLQDRPEVIPELYKKAQEGFDIVFVSRKNRPETLVYRITQKLFYRLLNAISGLKFDSTQANFSIINKKVVESFKLFPETARFYVSTINWLGYKRSKIEANHGVRFSGKTSYTLQKRIKLAIEVIVSFSNRPLNFAIYLGLTSVIVSLFGFFSIIYKYFTTGFAVSGWASLIITVVFFSGIVITILGVLGVYIGKIFQEAKNRPLYIISKNMNL